MNLAPFKAFIKERCGLTFEGNGEQQLQEKLCARISVCDSNSSDTYFKRLISDDHEFYELICLLTINETYFYRESEQLHFLVNRLLPRLLSYKDDTSPVRILSAGCSTGEEIYSISMALREKYGASAERLFWLAAGDIDKQALTKARSGRYTEFSFRGVPPELRERYFERYDKNSWIVKPEIRQSANFYHLNLLDGLYPETLQNFDVVFFRNVSIYFDGPTRQTIQQNIASLLKESGALIVGSAETLANDLGVLTMLEENGMFYFIKQPADSSVRTYFNILPLAAEPSVADFSVGSLNQFIADRPVEAAKPFPFPPLQNLTADPLIDETSSDTPTQSVANQPVESAEQPLFPALDSLPNVISFDQALNLIREKHYPEAMQHIESILKQKPDDQNALLLKASILLNQREFSATEKIALHVLETDTWSIDALVLLGLAMKWRNQTAEAVKWFKKAVYARHDCWIAHYYLAELYRAEQAPEKASRAYRVVLQLLSAASGVGNGLAIIPIDLPVSEVCFLCEHQLSKLDGSSSNTLH